MSSCASCKTRLTRAGKQCSECSKQYCRTCLSSRHDKFCETCKILNTRPADRSDLMNIRPRELQMYLARRKYPTANCIEKEELVVHFLKYVESEPKQRKNGKKVGFFSGIFNGLFHSSPNINEPTYHTTQTRSPPYPNARQNYPSTSHNQPRTHSPYSNTPAFEEPRRHSDSESETHFRTAPPRPPPPTFQWQDPAPSEEAANLSSSQPPPSFLNSHEEEAPQITNAKVPIDLSTIELLEDLKGLSIKQLKELLYINRVDYRGCVEKDELVSKVIPLWKQSQVKADFTDIPLDELCKVCMDAPLNSVLLECGHIVSCIDCGKQLSECPICRQYVTRVVHTFKA